MGEENKIPQIRFKGFGEEWEEKELDVLTDVLDGDRGHNYPNGSELQETGHTLFLSASNVTKNGFKFDKNSYITEEKSKSMGNGKLTVDDIVLTSRGSIGHIAWYNEDISQQVPFARINSGMLILRTKDFVMPCIVAQLLKSPLGKKKIDLISFGSAQPQLTKISVSNYTVTLPTDKVEQSKIGSYFQQLDTLITQHQRKHDKLLNVKKAMLAKMFPKKGAEVPEIRFKGFSEKWEERKLIDVAKYRNGKAHENNINEKGKYIVVNSRFVSTNADIKKFSNMQIEPLLKNEIAFVLSDVPNGRAIARTFLVGESNKYTLNQRIAGITPLENNDPYYIYIRLNRNRYFLQFDDGVKQTNLSKGDVEMFSDYYPNKKEQTKIGKLFKHLDTLLSLHQTELEKLKNIKKACLEKMFV